MANNYLMTAFSIDVTADEAALLKECFEVADRLEAGFAEETDLEEYTQRTSENFRKTFPLIESEPNGPFAAFIELFDDPDFVSFDCDLMIEDGENGSKCAIFSGDQVDVEACSRLIQAVCKSALPYGFQWATTCSTMRSDQFGGGYCVITETAITGGSTHQLMHTELERLREKPDA